MIFGTDITIPASTDASSPAIEKLGISSGVITEFKVRPRPGHAGLAHLVINYHNHPIAPTTKDMDLHGDADPIDWQDNIEINEPPYFLELVGWNDDDTYEHTFTVYVVVLPKSALLVNSITSAIAGLFRLIIPTRVSGGG